MVSAIEGFHCISLWLSLYTWCVCGRAHVDMGHACMSVISWGRTYNWHCIRMWIHRWSHMTYLGQVQQNGGSCQQIGFDLCHLMSKLASSKMVPHLELPHYHQANTPPPHGDGSHFYCREVVQFHHSCHLEWTVHLEVSTPLPAQLHRHSQLSVAELKWRGRTVWSNYTWN